MPIMVGIKAIKRWSKKRLMEKSKKQTRRPERIEPSSFSLSGLGYRFTC